MKIKSDNILIKDYEKLDFGFLTACDIVAETFGAEGRFILLDNGNEPCTLTQDGFHVSEKVRFSDKTCNFGAIQALKGAMMTVLRSGDSTTLTMILQQGYVRGIKRENFNKAVQRGIHTAVSEVYKHLEKLAKPASKKDYFRVAKVSCNNDEELAQIVIDAFEKAGEGKIVDIVKNENSTETKVFQQNGMIVDSGFSSAFFISNQNGTFDMENCPIICSATWGKDTNLVSKIKEYYQANGQKSPLLVILERPSSEMTEFLISMKKAHFNICCVGLSAYTEYDNTTLLGDISLFCGGEIFEPSVDSSKLVLGVADKVVVSESKMTISVSEKPEKVKELIKSLEEKEVKDNKTLESLANNTDYYED